MLGKLLKYDFRAQLRMLIPLWLGIIAMSVFSAISLSFVIRISSTSSSNIFIQIAQIITVLFTIAGVIALIAGSVVGMFLIVRHFYNTLMSDEGYLTFTLPVTTRRILVSKTISGYVLFLISSIVTLIAAFILVFFGLVLSGNVDLYDVFYPIRMMLQQLSSAGISLAFTIILFALLVVVSPLQQLLHIYLAIIIGTKVSKKQKILASIGFYFVINMAVGCISSVFSVMSMFGNQLSTAVSVLAYYNFMLGFSAALSLILSAAFFFIGNAILSKNLNLE